SVCWLAQFVCQIVTALGWQDEFRCKGIENLVEFKAFVEGMSSVDPGSYVFSLPEDRDAEGPFSVPDFAQKMDALLDLLDLTAEALAVELDVRSEVAEAEWQE